MRPAFEYDPNKSASNKAKHGIDFEEAKAIWDGPKIEAALPLRNEMRYSVIGQISGKRWTAIITYRGSTVRIISVRPSRPSETA